MSKKFSSPFSKVFFVKGKEGKRASPSFYAWCERAWADPERRRAPTREETNARHQHKDSRQNKHRNRGRTRITSRTRHPKEEQKIRLKLDENTDTVTENTISVVLSFLVLQLSSILRFFQFSRIFANFESVEKYTNHKNLILHSERNPESWKLESLWKPENC